eukprot:g8992.t1
MSASTRLKADCFQELFLEADQLTEGFPVGFLRHLTPYWKTSPEDAKDDTFKSLRLKVLKFLKDARRSSDEALLAAALLKRLADVLFTVRKDARRASDLLAAAQKKAPEAGQGPALARLLGQQFRWKDRFFTSEALELHLVHFPEDSGAALMFEQMAIKQLSPVPPLPANYAERRGLGGAVAQSLQKCLQASGLCLVHGAGGMGKTVQTCATIHQETVLSEIFPDGVAYVTVGQSPDLVARRKALLILDDVWDAQHLEFLVPLKGRPKSWLQNAVLITSRRVDLLGSAELLRLGELTEEEAQQLLNNPGDLPLVAKLAKLCSKSPLALSILGATGLREEERTSSKRSSIFNSFLTELTGRKEEPNAVKRCIELCSKRLSSEELELYLDLAVFPDDVLLPVGALRNIFAGRDLEALKELERLHLLGMESSGRCATVRLDDTG